MKTLRSLLAFPVRILCYVVLGISALFGWIGRRLMPWLSRGTVTHFLWPIVTAARWIAGKPIWQVQDLALGRQPRTAADRKICDEHPDVTPSCICGNPECRAKDKYSFAPGAKKATTAQPKVTRSIVDDMPPEVKKHFIDSMRQMVGYDELQAAYDAQTRLIKSLERSLENGRLIMESDAKLLEKDGEVINNQRGVIAELEAQLAARDERIADLDAKFSDLEKRVHDFRAAHAN